MLTFEAHNHMQIAANKPTLTHPTEFDTEDSIEMSPKKLDNVLKKNYQLIRVSFEKGEKWGASFIIPRN